MATRLYLSEGIDPVVTGLAASSPAFDAGWNETDGALRRLMVPQAVASEYAWALDALANGSALASTAANRQLHRQYVSLPMIAGIDFTGVTYGCQIMGLESAANDNIINRVRKVLIVSRDGSTVRSTQIAIGNAASVVEWNTAMRNLTFLAATAGAAYTTVAGDRLVVEVGHLDSGGVSISATMRFGVTGQTADLGANETDTTTTLRPWFESSVNLTFEKSSPPPRRDIVHANAQLRPAVGW